MKVLKNLAEILTYYGKSRIDVKATVNSFGVPVLHYDNIAALEGLKDVSNLEVFLEELVSENEKLKRNVQDTYEMWKSLIKSFEIAIEELSKYQKCLRELKELVSFINEDYIKTDDLYSGGRGLENTKAEILAKIKEGLN